MKKHIDNAVIISATLVWETSSAYYLNCEGDRVWVAKSQCNFDPDKQELEDPSWLLRRLFPGEDFK